MQSIFRELLILMIVVWAVAVILRRIGLPTIMGELLLGVIVGPAVLGWVHPNEVIEVLAQLGIFFLMLHSGLTTEPREFFSAVKSSIGVAIVGAIVPFTVALTIALLFGLELRSAIFVGLVFTATAVVITLKVLRDLGLANTRMARMIIASCVLDDLLTLVFFGFLLGLLRDGSFDPMDLLTVSAKVIFFFSVSIAVGYWGYPLLKHPFRDRSGKGFTFVLVLALAAGLFAEAIGLHIILGAYIAGLFLEERVASKELMQKVEDRLSGIAYSFLGPIFFISLGFHITFEVIKSSGIWLIAALTAGVFVAQVLSAGFMARLAGLSRMEAVGVGVGMSGRAELAFILASLGLSMGFLDPEVFSVLIFSSFLLNLLTSIGLKLCAKRLGGSVDHGIAVDY